MSFVVRKDPSHQFPYPESGFCNFDIACDPGHGLTGLHGILEPTNPQFRNRTDKEPCVGMERRRQNVSGKTLFNHSPGIENNDLVGK